MKYSSAGKIELNISLVKMGVSDQKIFEHSQKICISILNCYKYFNIISIRN